MAESKANIPLDDFVAKVVKDPKQPPDTILLTGYLGKSSEEGHTRLHFDPDLKSYVEIPNDAILHTQPIPKEQSSLGGSHVWIKRDAELIHGKVGPSRTKAKFFEGPIAAAAAVGGGQVGGPGGGAGNSVLPQCDFTADSVCACPSLPLLCPTPLCLPTSPERGCPATIQFTQCATPLHGCPPPTQWTQCPTIAHGCPQTVALRGCPIHSHLLPCFSQPVYNCPAQTANCPIATAHACPSFGACPSIQCGFQPGGGEQVMAAQQVAGAFPTAPQVACPSHAAPCPTSPVFCHPTPACPSFHMPCLTPNPLICNPTPACPSHNVICQTSPAICNLTHFCSPSHNVICPTGPAICQFTPTCPTIHACQSIPACPSALGCPSLACGGPGGGINQ